MTFPSSAEEQKISNHIRTATGYLDLGMALDAWNELESINSEHRDLADVLKVRLEVCCALEKWEMMKDIAFFLSKEEPDESGHFLNLAYALRRCDDVESAEKILNDAATKFPEDPLVKYNLGCYRAVLGKVGEAKLNLAEAFQRVPALRLTALNDPDLEGVL
jgi:predicted Zn-dependent protease